MNKAAKEGNRYRTVHLNEDGIIMVAGNLYRGLDVLKEWHPTIEWLDESAPSEQLFTREDMQNAFEAGQFGGAKYQAGDHNHAFDDFMQTNYPKQ